MKPHYKALGTGLQATLFPVTTSSIGIIVYPDIKTINIPGLIDANDCVAKQQAQPNKISDLHTWIHLNLAADLRVENLAKQVFKSPRNFARWFLTETSITPAKFVELARVNAARHYLACSQLSLEVIAGNVGFDNTERMRRAFARHLGINPNDYRKRIRNAQPSSWPNKIRKENEPCKQNKQFPAGI